MRGLGEHSKPAVEGIRFDGTDFQYRQDPEWARPPKWAKGGESKPEEKPSTTTSAPVPQHGLAGSEDAKPGFGQAPMGA